MRASQSELEDYLKDAVQKAGRYLSFDTHTETGSYFRFPKWKQGSEFKAIRKSLGKE